jgi:rod shape-determining protein MreB
VISLGAIVVSRSVRVGGYELDEAISHYMRDAHQLAIGSQTAEAIKLEIGSAAPLERELTTGVRGRHLLSGLPTEIQLHSAEVREAIRLPMKEILRAITATLADTPPELAGDIAREGILLAGGGQPGAMHVSPQVEAGKLSNRFPVRRPCKPQDARDDREVRGAIHA